MTQSCPAMISLARAVNFKWHKMFKSVVVEKNYGKINANDSQSIFCPKVLQILEILSNEDHMFLHINVFCTGFHAFEPQ